MEASCYTCLSYDATNNICPNTNQPARFHGPFCSYQFLPQTQLIDRINDTEKEIEQWCFPLVRKSPYLKAAIVTGILAVISIIFACSNSLWFVASAVIFVFITVWCLGQIWLNRKKLQDKIDGYNKQMKSYY